ncbi:hypothetical protein HPB51_011476 [Rhipicephalus microplus]|uniref:Endonuclease/exonuclease/phosphatase domain-containing protein n=1 Tax=Rhipicephalus microplus TaxID=6941 RepID=A0A9J6E8Y3_RHIMP|nr:hypothetical protein HPB51_011476 [Rhipicephalus microplus]
MDSAPSQHGDDAVLFAPMEARLSSLETRMASIVTTIEDRVVATLQTVFNCIPGMRVTQLPQHALNSRRSKLKRVSNSQASWPLSQVAAVDEQSNSSTATSEVSTGLSSRAPVSPFALVDPPPLPLKYAPTMASNGPRSRGDRANSDLVTILQWNCQGFNPRTKRAALQLDLETYPHLPAVVALQKPGEHAALTNYTVYQRDAQSAFCMHRDYTTNQVDLDCDPLYSYVMVTILPLRKQNASLQIFNIYSWPKHRNVTYNAVLAKPLQWQAGNC